MSGVLYSGLPSGLPPAAASTGMGMGATRAAVLYGAAPSVAKVPAPTVEPAAPAPSATERALAAAEPEEGEARPTAAQALYGDSPPTNGPVDFEEPVAPARDLAKVLVPPAAEGWDHGPDGVAERQALAEALVHAGAGRGITREVWGDFQAAVTQPVTISPDQAMAQLQRAWGPQTVAKIDAARGLVAKVAERFPGVMDYLDATGLGNDPAFIRKLAARAARMPR